MDENKIMSFEEWYIINHEKNQVFVDSGSHLWYKIINEYAKYHTSERLKQEIKLPEEFPYLKTQYEVGFNNAIGQVKELNDIK